MDFSHLHLGCNPSDPARLARAPRLDRHVMALAPPPASLSHRATIHYGQQLDDNDVLSDCGPVGLANGARADAALHGYTLNIPTAAVLNLYGRFGYRPGVAGTDNGTVLLDLLANQATQGWWAADQLELVGPFATLDPGDRAMLARVLNRVGWGYCAVNLALADQVSLVWDTNTPASAGDPTPGSWGGHCLVPLYYDGLADDDLIYLATWGMIHPARWRWWRSRVREAHAVMWRPLAGVDYDRLCADVATFTA
jgi:hypothetical protein